MSQDVTKISQLTESVDFANLWTIGTLDDGQGNVVSKKVSLANLLKVISSVSVTESQEDGGTNVVVFTLLNGTTYTLNVKNGTKGSQGIQGIQGPTGATGATGATGNGIASIEAVSVSTENGGHSVYRITMTSGATFDFTVYNGVFDPDVTVKLAENLESWAEDVSPVENDFGDTIRTTAGEDPIVTDNGGVLKKIRATSDFKCTGFRATAYNQLRLASAGGGAVAVGTGWYFPVPKLTYGAFGDASENNGLLLTDNEGNNISNATVLFKALADGVPTSVNDGTTCPSQTVTYNGKSYKVYTTSGPGYLIVSGITYANTCAHIAWEDWYDKFVSPTDADDNGDNISLSGLFSAAPNGTGKFLVCGNVATEAVRTDATHMLITDPIARVASPSWTNTLQEDGETYLHTLVINGMKSGGAAMIEGSSQVLNVDETTVSYSDQNSSAISGAVRYELASPVTASVALTKTAYALNDCGVEVKEGAEGTADFTCGYSQNIADAASQAVKITVPRLQEGLEATDKEVERAGYKVPFEAAFDRMPTLGGQPGILFCNGAPTASNKPTNWIDFLDGGYNWTGLPNVEGQHVLDYTNHINYYGWRNPSTGLLEWKN